MNDTAPSIAGIVLEGYRAMSSSDRLRRMSALTVDLRRLVVADVRSRHPDASDRMVRAEHARRLLPPDLAERVIQADDDR
jgi:hypothetical protein